MNTDAPAAAALERALALALADGREAARHARTALCTAGDDALLRAAACGVLALVALREGRPRSGLCRIRIGESLLPPGADDSRAAQLLRHARSQQLRRDGELAEAQVLLEALHAQADARPAGDAYLSASALGIVLSMRGDNEASLEVMYQSLLLARRSGIDSFVVNALSNLGSFEADHYNLDDARPMLEEALDGALRLGSRRQAIFAAGNLVQCLCMMGDAPRALALARQHLQGLIRDDDPPALRRDEEIAAAMLDNGLVDDAEATLSREAGVDPMTNEVATARVALQARLWLARGRAADALAHCQARRAVLAAGGQEVTPAKDHVDLLQVAASAAAAVGEHAAAYALLQEAFSTYERLLGRAARWRRLSLNISHRLRQAEWERDSARQFAASLETLNTTLRTEMAENARLQQRLVAQAMQDPLTGLYNRRHLFEAGPALLELCRRQGGRLAAALIDLDHFKQVNDQHGHDAGDRVLRGFAEMMSAHTRAGDLVCRYGGEEFVVLLPGADTDQAVARLQGLLGRFRLQRFSGSAGDFGCSFSAGIAAWRGGVETLERLLQRADAALYGVKAAGRNDVGQAD